MSELQAKGVPTVVGCRAAVPAQGTGDAAASFGMISATESQPPARRVEPDSGPGESPTNSARSLHDDYFEIHIAPLFHFTNN